MKKLISVLLILTLSLGSASVFTACTAKEEPHEHTYSEEWSFSADTHWKSSTCGHQLKSEEAAHNFGEPTFTSDYTAAVYSCSVCGYMKSESHAHTYGEWQTTKSATIFEAGTKERVCKFVGCEAKESETIDKIAVATIYVKSLPTKLNYVSGEAFNPSGIVVMAVGSDSSETDITSLVSYDKTTLAEADTKVTVSFEGKSAEIIVSVIGLNNHTHTYGGEWQVLTPATIFAEGQKYRECSFDGCSHKEYDTIPRVQISGITVSKNPDRTTYLEGEKFKSEGILVMANGADGSLTDITALVSYDKTVLTNADTTVTVSYEGKSASIQITVTSAVSIKDALDTSSYGKELWVEGIYVGISDEGSGDDKEILLKDADGDALIAVRGVPYGAFPDYGYEYGDKVRILAKVVRISYDEAEDNNQNKTYLQFSEDNSSQILDTIVSRGNRVSFSLENVPVIDSWSDMKAFFKGNLEMYAYVRISGKMWFNSYNNTDKTLIHRLTMNSSASKIAAIKPDGKRAVGIRQVMLEANVPASLSMYFNNAFGVMNETNPDYPAEGAKSVDLDFYAVVTASNSVNYQLTILSPSWLLGTSEEVKTENYDNGDIVKEVGMAYHRQNSQIYYCDYWRDENISPEAATAQRNVSLDCSSFVNAVYYEAFGENVLGVAITTTEPKTKSFAEYAAKYNGKRSDVVGHWKTADYTDPAERKALLADVFESLEVGDVLVYRRTKVGESSTSTGHVILYIGNGTFLHSTGGINGHNKTNPDKAVDKCSTSEYTYGTVLKLDAAKLFVDESSSYYLFLSNEERSVTTFSVIRPLARGLTPNEKTVNRMKISGISMEKTVSVGLDKAVTPGSLITYTLELENYSTKSYENVLFEDKIPEGTSFVSGTQGLVLVGSKLSMEVDVEAMSKYTVCWTVKVNESLPVGTKIVSDGTYFGGVNVFNTTNYVSRYSQAELKEVADKAREYADGTTVYSDPIELANKIYSEVLGTELGFTSAKDVIASAFTSLTSTSTTIKSDGVYKDMIIPTLYSGTDLKPTVAHTSVHNISDFMLGDIILCRWNGENYRMFIYVGDSQFVKIDTTTGTASVVDNGSENFTFSATSSTRFSRTSITSQLRSYGKCVVLRPTISE